MENTCRTRIASPGRSEGDGMENTSFEADPPRRRDVDSYLKHFVPTQGKTREPKFVPYEPYKAAVSPILPHPHQKKVEERFVIDSQRVSSLASSIIRSSMGAKDLFPPPPEKKCHSDCGDRIQKMEERISALEKEKKEMAAQYQVQTEVNGDLKKLLVASLGEDVQLRVQFMTEDKAALGKEVLRLSHALDTALEERERRDVWESKFKASSLLVKELAHWKSLLSQMVSDCASSLDQLMREHENVFQRLSAAHSKLESCLSDAQSGAKTSSPPKTLTQLSFEIASLASRVQERFLGRLVCDAKHVRKFTRAEHSAMQFLKSFEQMRMTGLPDSPISCQVQKHDCSSDTSVNFCKHCSGEVKLL